MRNKVWIIISLMLGTFMASLDSSIVNVSLPVMQKQFKVALDDIQWVITAYMLAFCVFMPLTNWLKSKIGLYKMYLISIVVFTVGSLLCGLSGGLSALVPARILQALGGGALTPVALSMLSLAFDEKERGTVMGWWGLGVIVGPALGPTLGGLITQYLGWPYIFFVNLPFGVLAFLLAMKYLKKVGDTRDNAPPFDLSGYLFFIVFITLFQYSVACIEKTGFSSITLYITFAISLLCLFGFIKTDVKKDNPVLNLSLFKSRAFVAGILVTVVRSVALFGGLFLLPFLLQGLMGYSELQTGLLLLPASAAVAAFMPVAGKWADKHGARYISIAGLALLVISTVQLAFLDKNSSVISIIIPMILRGVGLGFLFSPVSSAIINAAPKEHSATASSYYSLFMQIGGSIGISVLTVLYQYLLHHNGQHGNIADATHGALKGGFLLSAAIIMIAIWPAFKIPKQPLAGKQPDRAKNREVLNEANV
jgi:DHA2 family multidrug resistance protein